MIGEKSNAGFLLFFFFFCFCTPQEPQSSSTVAWCSGILRLGGVDSGVKLVDQVLVLPDMIRCGS